MADNEKTDAPTTNGGLPAPSEPMQQNGQTQSASVNLAMSEKEKKNEKNAFAASRSDSKKSKQPAGGFDATPIPHAPPGYTLKFTFHRAINLPMADINSLSSDPYVLAQINTGLPSRHKEDPPLQLRTPTVRRSTDPVFDCDWIVANVPASGFKLKARIYDEDPADHDDRLGNVHVNVSSIYDDWPGIINQKFEVKKRMGSKRAYIVRIIGVCLGMTKHFGGHMYLSVENLGKTPGSEGGRTYTIGPQWWTRHYSPLLGRILGKKEPEDEAVPNQYAVTKKHTERYNFQANQIQLRGPVPEKLYHRYVEFKPFVKSMFTSKGIRGFILSKALHHQHARVYNYDRSTKHGKFDEPCKEMTEQFLDLVHYDKGGRIFTYVITLDALWRFTETGKEFGIDMLSKHTMHSDVSIYIAFSGEFFIRRLKLPHHHHSRHTSSESHNKLEEYHQDQDTHSPDDIEGGPREEEPPKDPAYYELIIDNDSGTYRPNAKLLPILKDFLESNLLGLKVVTLDCQADSDLMSKMKSEQRNRKKAEGGRVVFRQMSISSSISSSDEEELDELERLQNEEEAETRLRAAVKREWKAKQQAKKDHVKGLTTKLGTGDGHKGHMAPIETETAGGS